MKPVTLVVWNTAWAPARSRRGEIMREQILAQDPDLVCLTEAVTDSTFAGWHAAESHADYGYRAPANRRKVILWSKAPWQCVDSVGDPALPSGRYVSASTITSLGPLLVIGVCIPWRDAHVRTGLRVRRPWEDHLAYLSALPRLTTRDFDTPAVLAGDFNQRVPPVRAPASMAEALRSALGTFRIVTSGAIPGLDQPSIDHVALSPDLVAYSVRGIPAGHAGTRLSDHPGIVVRFARTGP
jgi:endonuclease/exonuclease/phosphatase family metal-dependent hydrolase